MEPQKTSVAPQGTAVAPQGTAVAPQGTAVAPQGTAVAPQGTAVAPNNRQPRPNNKDTEDKTGQEISLGGYMLKVEKLIGRGSEGDLYIVTDKNKKGKKYALKLYHKGYHPNTKVLPALAKLNGKDLIADVISYGDNYELMEFMKDGSVAGMSLKGNAQMILAITVKMAMVLDAMHKAGVIHKDMKPANILVKDKDKLQFTLCDFGIADLLGKDRKCVTEQSRTPIYAAPELYDSVKAIIEDNKYKFEVTPKVDFYSLGMTILSLWVGEKAFDAQEAKLAIDKKNGRIEVPADMPNPLNRICRGLLLKNPAKRWDLEEIERTINGEEVPVEEDQINEDLNIIYNAQKHQIANTPEQLAAFMMEDKGLAKKYLYRGDIEKWLKIYPEISTEMQEIVEKRYPTDQESGLYAAIYFLDPGTTFHLSGVTKYDIEEVTKEAQTLKDVSNFFNDNFADDETYEAIASTSFYEWVRVRSIDLADKLPGNDNVNETAMLRVQTIDPLSDIMMINDPEDPDYAMTQEGLGRLFNRLYNLYLNHCEADSELLSEILRGEDCEPLTYKIPSNVVSSIICNIIDPEEHSYVTDFFKTKGTRFSNQEDFFTNCLDDTDEDYQKKAGPKDEEFFLQSSWMKIIKGFGVDPVYENTNTNVKCESLEDFHALSRKQMQKEYNDCGLRGWLAVMHQEDPQADFSEQFAYENRLHDYVEELRRVDSKMEPVTRFDEAVSIASNFIKKGKLTLGVLSTRSTVITVLNIVLAIVPALLLLAMLVCSIIEHPTIDTSSLKTGYFVWILGFIVAIVAFFVLDLDGCLLPIIIGVAGAIILEIAALFLGQYILYIYTVVVLAALVFFSIKTIFHKSEYAADARKFTRPGFEENVLEPLYYAFSDEDEFDSSLSVAFDEDEIDGWKNELKHDRKMMFFFIGAIWFLMIFSIFIPKSERFEKYSAPIFERLNISSEDETEIVLIESEALNPGDKGIEVKYMQQFLYEKGHIRNKPDGDYGKGTALAVGKYQKANGLEINGLADKPTIELINKQAAEENIVEKIKDKVDQKAPK